MSYNINKVKYKYCSPSTFFFFTFFAIKKLKFRIQTVLNKGQKFNQISNNLFHTSSRIYFFNELDPPE